MRKFFIKKTKETEHKKGFTILETLVAIFILTVAVTGPMVFAQNSLRSAFLSRDQITAFYLAQDAIEFVKNIRDENMVEDLLDPNPPSVNYWLIKDGDGILNQCINNFCTIDTIEEDIDNCGTNIGCDSENPLVVDLNGYYRAKNVSNSTKSIFSRKIEIEPLDASGQTVNDFTSEEVDEAKVTVVISWQSHSLLPIRTITVTEFIRKWAPLNI